MASDEIEMKEEIVPFDPTKKKKKKKVVIQDPSEEPLEKTEKLSVSEGTEPSFAGLKKKKKKPVETSLLSDDAGEPEDKNCKTRNYSLCGSGRSVAPIKAGFVARVGRRSAA